MATSYIAKGGERLDSVIQKEFQNLNLFEEILKNNPHIQNKIFLDLGDIISFKIDAKKDFVILTEDSQREPNDALNSSSVTEIAFKEPLDAVNEEENLKALW